MVTCTHDGQALLALQPISTYLGDLMCWGEKNQHTVTLEQQMLHINAAAARNGTETTSRGDTDLSPGLKGP